MMRTSDEIEYAISALRDTEDAARQQDNGAVTILAVALADALEWVLGRPGQSFEKFVETALAGEVKN